jgi:hypothetical protein
LLILVHERYFDRLMQTELRASPSWSEARAEGEEKYGPDGDDGTVG